MWQGSRVDRPSVVTIGVFDGVHVGHQALIRHNLEIAERHNLESVVVTFDPNPLEVLRPEVAPTRLCDLSRRVELIARLGVELVEVIEFDTGLSAQTAEEFARDVLLEQLDARHVVIGEGFRFGNRARGSAQTLRDAGLTVDEYSLVGDSEVVSSTRIRAAVADGDVVGAAAMLGRPHEVAGVVVMGEQRGRELGFPTANIEHHRLAAVPSDGVYAGTAVLDGVRHPAAISVGTNPTFEGTARTVEAYLLDLDQDLYGRLMRVEFVERLRDTLAFDSVDDLVTQMHEDVAVTRRIVG
ncbi:MAG: bifunctional riboflavin kinase/FAD synthetase [Actinobacteria bacterium]|nr:MAG: bifunctional riboflavin kinase/FAD synthetase [Actinomycetota bacterium]